MMEQSTGISRRKFVGNGILAALLSGSIARPAMGEAGAEGSVEYGKQPYLRQTLKLIDGGDLRIAEQRLTKSIGAWKNSAVDMTVLLKVRHKPQTTNHETNNLPEVHERPLVSLNPKPQTMKQTICPKYMSGLSSA